MCSVVETEIAVVPPNNNGRWLPLASLSLYEVADDGGLGPLVVCQMKRWCCLISIPTCGNIHPPCSPPCSGDCINAGTRDVYPVHFQDQFVPIQNVPSGTYWFEHRINPAGVLIVESPGGPVQVIVANPTRYKAGEVVQVRTTARATQ